MKKISKQEAGKAAGKRNSKEQEADVTERKTPIIVGIGASAGGLAALEILFKQMADDSGMAFVLVVHLDPDRSSIMADLLQKYTNMPVQQVVDGVQIKPDNVYVIPPNKNLSILNGKLQLVELAQRHGSSFPINFFFQELSVDQGSNAVAIVLSGTGTDGSLGIKAIKSEQGMVMAQDEGSAQYDGMPTSAVSTGLVDYVLSPEKMPDQLVKYFKHISQGRFVDIDVEDPLISEALPKIFVLLRSQTGHDFSLYKKNTIFRRIERRMIVNKIDNISNYIRFLEKSSQEVLTLFQELLIGVTNFFRDPEAFERLESDVIPELLASKPVDATLRVWVPGCATGEEVYSIAIVLHECMQRAGRKMEVQIFGTDLDENSIKTARAANYSESIVANVTPERLKRYFIKGEYGGYQIKKVIREMVVFAPQNLIKDPPFTKLDLLCCRNLLIYLGAELQRKLLPLFHYSLRPEGVLFLGSSETVGRATDMFKMLDKKWKIYRCNPEAKTTPEYPLTTVLPVSAAVSKPKSAALNIPETVREAEELSAIRLVEAILEESQTPPSVIINADFNIVYIHGHTGKFLELAPGRSSVNILDMAQKGIKAELSTAIRQVKEHKHEVCCEKLRVTQDGGLFLLSLTVRPILGYGALQGLMMVIFEELKATEESNGGETETLRDKKTVAELEAELRYNKENLQVTVGVPELR